MLLLLMNVKIKNKLKKWSLVKMIKKRLKMIQKNKLQMNKSFKIILSKRMIILKNNKLNF